MTINTIALVQQGNSIKVLKEKFVSVSLNQKGDQSFKFEGCYPAESSSHSYNNHVQKAIIDVLFGVNCSVVSLATNLTAGHNAIFLEENSLLQCSIKEIFSQIQKNSSKFEYLVSVSMMQVSENGTFLDLINPHSRTISIKKHGKQGLYADELTFLVCSVTDDVIHLVEDGLQVQNAVNVTPHLTCVTLRILQRPAGNSTSGSTTAFLKFVQLHTERASISSTASLFSEVVKKKGKLNRSSLDSEKNEIIADTLLDNSNTYLIAIVDSGDLELSSNVLSLVEQMSGIGSSPKVNREDNEAMIQQLRHDIARVRNKLASQSPPNKNDLTMMEKLMNDLDETKRNGWDQTVLRSDKFHEERRNNFANRGLTWILESTKPANRENIKNLQKLKDKLTSEYKNQRLITERLNTDLKQKIDNYSQLIKSGNKDDNTKKTHVTAISELKEQYRNESDKLKEIKSKVKEAQNKLQAERQSGYEESVSRFDVAFEAMKEERRKTRQENEQLIDEEVQKMKIEVEQEKADLQMKHSTNTLVKSDDLLLRDLMDLSQLRSEKSVMTSQLDILRKERAQLEEHMLILLDKHSRELEIQQLQSMQTFRAYREVFEEYKVELENRWRSLLDDAVQDAVFLNSRNTELIEEQAKLKLEIARFKDERSIGKVAVGNN